jgi:hypothetical protein
VALHLAEIDVNRCLSSVALTRRELNKVRFVTCLELVYGPCYGPCSRPFDRVSSLYRRWRICAATSS